MLIQIPFYVFFPRSAIFVRFIFQTPKRRYMRVRAHTEQDGHCGGATRAR